MALSISKASVFAVHAMGFCFQMYLFKTAFLIVGVLIVVVWIAEEKS